MHILRRRWRKGKVFPCFYRSALKLDRVETLIQGLSRFMCERNYHDEFSARVYKIGRDYTGIVTFLKVTGGCLRVRDKETTKRMAVTRRKAFWSRKSIR